MENNELLNLDNEEIEGLEEVENKHWVYPIDSDKITTSVNNYTLFNIIWLIKKEKIELQPIFQRTYVWNDEKAEMFIDSLWKRLPIPQIFLLSKEDWKILVIDWQQRLTSLLRFMLSEEDLEKYLPEITYNWLYDNWHISLEVNWEIFGLKNKIKYSDLSADVINKFEDRNLNFVQIQPIYSLLKNDEAQKLSKDIFYRLNTWWIKLTEQEIRQSLYSWKFMDEIKKISLSNSWKNLFPWIKKIKENPSLLTELLIRAFSLLDLYGSSLEDTIIKLNSIKKDFKYFKPLSDFLDEYAEITEKFDDTYINDRIILLKRVLDDLNKIITDKSLFKHLSNIKNPNSNKILNKSLNIIYIDTLFVWILNSYRVNDNIDLEKLLLKIEEFKKNPAFIELIIKPWSSDPSYVKDRVEKSINFFNN